ncbi:unnamed protein product [Nezara viridula]|uniref:Sperm flagellar protein 2 n=1 Tax=Nezara viridula TaxID=85310 RepID=A0A9P0MS12_NEZVI|nr:unnamed protein product [Nezara viridula]
MTEVIGNWLLNSVRCNIKCTPETLGNACFDGKIFAQILVTYNVCSSDYLKLINETVSKKVALSNLKKLCVWFKLLGISITDEFLEEIVNKNGSASLRLLYELFIRLENNENLIWMDSKKMQRMLSESTDKFLVTPVKDLHAVPDTVDEKQYLRDLLNTMKGVMESSEKNSLKRFLVRGMKRRAEKVKKQIMADDFPPYKCYDNKTSFPHFDAQAKIKEFEDLMESPEGRENQKQIYNCDPEEYIEYLKLKRLKADADKQLKLKLGKYSMEDAWKKILNNQELELKKLLSIKLLKQSEYEKQMTLRLKRMRLKYQKFIDTRNMVMGMAEKLEVVNKFRSSFVAIKDQERTQIEKQRIKELHQRLFEGKRKLKKLLDLKACRKIMEDIVDFAMITHDYFEKNGMKMPKNKTTELKLLFMKGIRLLPHDLIPKKAEDIEDKPIILDEERLEELSEYDFYLYMYCIGPWCLHKRTSAEEDELLNITGFIVHRLLDLKYNFGLSVGEPANLPIYNYKIFLQRINDTFALEKLKHYLSKFKIEVFDISQVINYFLNSYRSYIGQDALKETSKTVHPNKVRANSVPTIKNDKTRVKPWFGAAEKVKEKTNADKAVQYPSDEKLTKEKTQSVETGNYIYNILQAGGLLPDAFLCYLIIEYLKNLKDVDGWVLINFPENITQVGILEFMLSGLEVPYMPRITQNIKKLIESQLNEAMPKTGMTGILSQSSLYEAKNEEYESQFPDHFSVEELLELKSSNILPRPYPPPEPLQFESFFTKVVIMQHEGEKKVGRRYSKLLQKVSAEGEEIVEEDVTLETFYASQDISSTFPYKYLDTTTLKKLLTFILNMSASKQNEYLKNLEKGVDLMVKPVRSDQKVGLPKPLKFKRNALDDWVLKTFLENEEGFLEEIGEEEGMEDEIIIFPGHRDWEYTEFVIPEFYVGVLATVWESIEYFYTCNLKKCFALLRTVERRLMPYRNYVRKKAEECLILDDDRTEAVTNFQLMLNKINDHYRPLDSMKSELHDRILKLQCELWKMTDVKKFYCEQVLQLILNQNWISGHLMHVLQVYCLILQAETDRFTDTMQLIDDYYCVSVLGKPQEERLIKIILPRVGLKPDKKEESVRRVSRHLVSASATKKGRGGTEDKHSKMTLDFDASKTCLYYTDYEATKNPAVSLLKALIARLTKNILQMKAFCESRSHAVTDKRKDISKANDKSDSRTRMSKDLTHTQRRLTKDFHAASETNVFTVNKVSLEWTFAIENESKRALYRINLLEKRASADLNEDVDIIDNTFKEFKQDIVNLYHNQILNIDKLCDMMRAAVEEEVKIQPLVVLRNDALEIDTSVIVYPNPPPPPPSFLVEVPTGFKFTISQLTNLFYKLVYVAPYGIVEQTFALILEDMASIGHETGHSYLPHYWSDLSADRIKDIVHRLYGDKVIIDWRLFIVFGLDLGYPTLEDILEMKKSFEVLDTNLTETVTYEQYSCVFLWFESTETISISQDLYIAKAKELIFKLFQIDQNLMNYTDFLLAFCRDYDPREGFVKALALAEGCATVCWKQDLFRETFQIEKENEKYNIAYGILTIVMAGVYRIVDSVIITDLNNEEEGLLTPICSISSLPYKRSTRSALKKRKRSLTNTTSSEERSLIDDDGTGLVSQNQSEEEESVPLRFDLVAPKISWKSDVYFSTAFSLLMLDIHHFALSSDQIYEPFCLEENLRRIFHEKGKDHSIKLFSLMSDVYIQKLFTSYRCFQAFSLPQLLMKIAKDDCSSVVDQN